MITITVRNRLPKGEVFYYEPEVEVITGTLVPNPEWIANDCLTIQTDDPSLPLRIIPKRDIVGTPPDPPKAERVSYQVKGSKGNLYTVERVGPLWSCTCMGFQFRKDCKHIREMKGKETPT
jgi:hypothetical protein